MNPSLNEGLPAFLASQPGIESGMMMAQVTAAALVAEMRVLASPASTGSIPTSGNQEDFVSMGMTSGLKLEQSADLARMVVAIELLAAARALDLRGDTSTPVVQKARARFRRRVPAWRVTAWRVPPWVWFQPCVSRRSTMTESGGSVTHTDSVRPKALTGADSTRPRFPQPAPP